MFDQWMLFAPVRATAKTRAAAHDAVDRKLVPQLEHDVLVVALFCVVGLNALFLRLSPVDAGLLFAWAFACLGIYSLSRSVSHLVAFLPPRKTE